MRVSRRQVRTTTPRSCGLLLAFVLACLTAACATSRGPAAGESADAQAPQPLRVMSFNVRYGTAPDGDHAWPLRRELAFDVIRDFQPAVLGVQEALRFQLEELRSALPRYDLAGVGRDPGPDAGEYSAILYDRQRLDLLEQATFWLSDTPDVPSASWGNRFRRIVTWARLRDRTTGATFFAFNTHWDHESQPARERSARLLLERIQQREPADPVLLTGDFNAGEHNPAFLALLRGTPRLHDTFRAVHPQLSPAGTYHAFTGDRSGDRIDAILASGEWRTLAAEIVLTRRAGRYPSDHFPVTATLLLRDAPRR